MTKSDTKADMLGSIVASFAARPDVSPDDIVELVAKLKRELGIADLAAAAGQPETAAPAPLRNQPEPALPIEQAVTNDKVFCLCCGKGFKMLKRHLGAEHGMTEADYRAHFSLPEDMPLVAPSYSSRKASYARQVGFGKYRRGEQHAETEQGEGVS